MNAQKKFSRIIYLDNNATTQVAAEASAEMCACLRTCFGNPSSSHTPGLTARAAIDRARIQVAGLIGAKPDEIIFTSGGTEANNMAIMGTAFMFKKGHIITSCIEHPSVTEPLRHLEDLGCRVTCLPVDRYGIVDPSEVERQLKTSTVLISIMHSNNETGSIQPVADIGKIAGKRGIAFHCDAAQSVGKIPVNVKRLRVDLLTIVSHKFYGPKGTGALYVKKGTALKPVLFGASHEKGLRPGTENVAGIAGLGQAAALAKRELPERVASMKFLSKKLYDGLSREIPEIRMNGHPSKRLPNTLNISFPGVQGSTLLEQLKDHIAASTGSACHEGSHTPSAVLKAMGLSDSDAFSALRLSLGRMNTERQIKRAVRLIVKAYRGLVIS
jgi:cysteine desulfurase